MRTDFPTVDLYFEFAFTYCRLRVYTTEEVFARKILAMARAEMMTGNENESWAEWDTRVLLGVLRNVLPQMIAGAAPKPEDIAKAILEGPPQL